MSMEGAKEQVRGKAGKNGERLAIIEARDDGDYERCVASVYDEVYRTVETRVKSLRKVGGFNWATS